MRSACPVKLAVESGRGPLSNASKIVGASVGPLSYTHYGEPSGKALSSAAGCPNENSVVQSLASDDIFIHRQPKSPRFKTSRTPIVARPLAAGPLK